MKDNNQICLTIGPIQAFISRYLSSSPLFTFSDVCQLCRHTVLFFRDLWFVDFVFLIQIFDESKLLKWRLKFYSSTTAAAYPLKLLDRMGHRDQRIQIKGNISISKSHIEHLITQFPWGCSSYCPFKLSFLRGFWWRQAIPNKVWGQLFVIC